MPKRKRPSHDPFTQDQMEELEGEYQQTDNQIPQSTKEKFALDEGDGVSTKRPQ